MLRRKFFRVVLLGFLGLLLAGCGEPSEEQARQVFENKLRRSLQPPYTLVSFQKTNGAHVNFMGMDIYEMQFVATVTYPGADLKCTSPLCMELSVGYGINVDKQNKRVTITGSVSFRKTERGWIPA
jgi:hypothetical protein